MKEPTTIILAPIITERSVEMANMGKYQFKVAIHSTKIEIGNAIEELYKSIKAKVTKVNTTVIKGKTKRYGNKNPGKKPDWKKAVITLAPGQKIDEFSV